MRPRIYDEGNLIATAKRFAKELREHFEGEGELESYERDIAKALAFTDFDGYRIAKSLDQIGYEVDAGVVEIFDNAFSVAREENRKRIKQWVIDSGIHPTFEVGALVKASDMGKIVDGEIVRIDAAQAEYVVFCESLGHVRSGSGTRGIYVPFEKVVGR